MIWLIFLALIAVLGLYLLVPFFQSDPQVSASKLDEARAQRDMVDLDEAEGRLSVPAAAEARDALDRRILGLIDQAEPKPTKRASKSMALIVIPAVLLLGGVGTYVQTGNPDYQPITYAEFQAQQAAALPDSLEELVVELKARLEADPDAPADGYVLLARSYLRLGDADSALQAYQTAIDVSGEIPVIVEERDRVLQILQDRAAAPPIDPEARAQIEAMSADEQAAMIANMVEGLAVRLQQDPNDLNGWLRLIRARAVMGDVAQARQDLAMAQQTFPPETEDGQLLSELAEQILPAE